MRTEMEASRKTLREYKQGNNFDESEFRAIAQKHADLKTEMMVQQAKTKQQIFAVLTPEQRQKAEKLRGMRGEGLFGKHGGMRDCDGHGKRNGQGPGQRYNN
jgi:protein CpxP